jgi:anti-sigma regulatory factor (Ser/Thr protein kinase)
MSEEKADFTHTALLYDDRDELLEGIHPFAEAANARGNALLVAMPSHSLEVVAEILDANSRLISFMDLDEVGRNPARLVSSWWDFAENEARDASGMSCIGECLWFGRSAAEIDECERHEQVLNLAFGQGSGLAMLCPYDRGRLAEDVIERVGQSHPELSGDGQPARPSETFIQPGHSDPLGGALGRVGGDVEKIEFAKSELAGLRGALRRHAREAGLDRTRQGDLALAGDELATNSIRYGGGGGAMWIWCDGEQIHCEVRDEGQITDPMAGRMRPAPDQIGGRGLWLANQLCDLVQIRSGPQGSVIRLSMRIGPSGRSSVATASLSGSKPVSLADGSKSFFHCCSDTKDPQRLLDPDCQFSEPWGTDDHGECDKCEGLGTALYECRSCLEAGARSDCPACQGRIRYRDTCPACLGDGHINHTRRRGIAVFPAREGLYRYLAEKGAEVNGKAIVELEGGLSEERDLDADAGALLLEPSRIITVQPLDIDLVKAIRARLARTG